MIQKAKLIVCVLIFMGAVGVVTFQGCNNKNENEKAKTKVELASNLGISASDFLGGENCKSCHQNQFEEWEGSHHDKAMDAANATTVLGDFDGAIFKGDNTTSKFFKKGKDFYVNTQGANGLFDDFKVVYVFGVAPLQQYLVALSNGKLQALSTAWDNQKKTWYDLYPTLDVQHTEWLHWSRGGLNWNSMCADCHSTYVEKNFDPETGAYATHFTSINVSCEACHGPGKAHVEWVQNEAYDADESKNILQLTSSLSSEQQVDQCARCHSRRSQITNAFDFEGEFMDHYVPSILRPELYHADGQIKDEVYVFGSFVQSKMYHNDVQCTDCHNPHTLELKIEGNGLCLQCHEKKEFDTKEHHFHGIESEGALCVNCHMPGKNYMGIDFRRDHSFRVPRPDQSVQFGTPNACTQCHDGKTDAWAAKAIEDHFGPNRKPHFSDVLTEASVNSETAVLPLLGLLKDATTPSIVKATAIAYLRGLPYPGVQEAMLQSLADKAPIVRHTAVLTLENSDPATIQAYALPLLKDKVRSVRYAAARVTALLPLQNIPQAYQEVFKNTQQEYRNSLDIQADFPAGSFMIGQFYEKINQPKNAEKAYIKTLQLDNYFNNARVNLARLYNLEKRNQEAIDLYHIILKQEPEYAQGYYSLGLLYAEENDLEKAKTNLEQAITLNPLNERAYYNLGLLFHNNGDTTYAESVYKQGLAKLPNSIPINHIMAILKVQNGSFDQAIPFVQFLLSVDPQNQDYLGLQRAIVENTK